VSNNSEQVQQYRAIASELLQRAEDAQKVELRSEFRQMAELYSRLADRAEYPSYSLPEIYGPKGKFLGVT